MHLELGASGSLQEPWIVYCIDAHHFSLDVGRASTAYSRLLMHVAAALPIERAGADSKWPSLMVLSIH